MTAERDSLFAARDLDAVREALDCLERGNRNGADHVAKHVRNGREALIRLEYRIGVMREALEKMPALGHESPKAASIARSALWSVGE